MTGRSDEQAEQFRAMYVRTYPAVHAYVSRRAGADDARDVVAEVYTTAWQRRDRIPEEPLPWLYRTAANHLLHQQRGSRRRARLAGRARAAQPPPAADPAEEVVGRLDDTRMVRRALQQLPADDAEVLRLWAWEHLSAEGIGRALGCTPGAARTRLHRARRRIAGLLAAADDPAAPPIPTAPSEELL